MLYSIVIITFLIQICVSNASHSSTIIFRRKESVSDPQNWVKIGKPPANQTISLRISLPQPGFSTLERHISEVSDPTHLRYGMYLSKEDVESIVSPPLDSVNAVNLWLGDNGIKERDCHRSPAGDWVKITIPVAQAERLLNTTYYIWKHTVDGDVLVRTLEYSLPPTVYSHVTHIQPTMMFARLRCQALTLF
ncbi:hypothetical protein BDN70DRAFT_898297 [Pholiota conissans]|uniref:Peptidase S53 activation domain-containing protein n=1 Tax=Pholiota conissans TaxID=109636 RepID=A0A9P5YTG5_9AGAR|nr:hypothetical protein BDN70DRAFT_898297 [Pholiota conissans]